MAYLTVGSGVDDALSLAKGGGAARADMGVKAGNKGKTRTTADDDEGMSTGVKILGGAVVLGSLALLARALTRPKRSSSAA